MFHRHRIATASAAASERLELERRELERLKLERPGPKRRGLRKRELSEIMRCKAYQFIGDFASAIEEPVDGNKRKTAGAVLPLNPS